jgi:hypothetical protein
LPMGRLAPGSVSNVELRLPWISRIARPDGVCRMFGSGFGELPLLPFAGIEMEIAGISARLQDVVDVGVLCTALGARSIVCNLL